MKILLKLSWLVAAMLLFLSSCGKSPAGKLTIVLVVDQMRPDFLTRFESLYTSGLKTLNDKGLIFTQSYYNHSSTATAVGHATIATGKDPFEHGIIGNSFYSYDHKWNIYAVYDPDAELLNYFTINTVSNKNLKAKSVGDLLKEENPKARVFSISIKDRAAITMGGQNPDGVYWLNKGSFNFITSKTYASELPSWLIDFNEKIYKDFNVDYEWKKLLDIDYAPYSREDDFSTEATSSTTALGLPWDATFNTFPHKFPKSGIREINYSMVDSPEGDRVTLELAIELIKKENLAMTTTDLLYLSLSNADYLGHLYGPYSQEVMDYYLRLDGYLGAFLKQLDSLIGKNKYNLILTADHGVLPLPEFLQRKGIEARRVLDIDFQVAVREIESKIRRKYKVQGGMILSFASAIFLDRSLKNDPYYMEIMKDLQEGIRSIDYVDDVYLQESIRDPEAAATAGIKNKEIFQLFVNNFKHLDDPLIHVVTKPNVLIAYSRFGTSHGTPWEYDRHVPIVVYGSNIKGAKIDQRVSQTDIAGTVGFLIGLETGMKKLPIDGNMVTK